MPTPLTIVRDHLLPVLTRRDDQVLGAVLDLVSGEVRTLYDPVRSGRDNAALEALQDRDPDRYVRVPNYDREYRLMCAFAAEVGDDTLANDLDVALTGPNAFRAFLATLDAAGALAGWSAYRERALLQFAEDWLATLGVSVAWNPPRGPRRPAGPEPGLVALLMMGDPGDEHADRVQRVLDCPTADEARQVFERAARDLCELAGQPWRRAYVRGSDRFAREAVELSIRDSTVQADIRLTPAWRALWGDG